MTVLGSINFTVSLARTGVNETRHIKSSSRAWIKSLGNRHTCQQWRWTHTRAHARWAGEQDNDWTESVGLWQVSRDGHVQLPRWRRSPDVKNKPQTHGRPAYYSGHQLCISHISMMKCQPKCYGLIKWAMRPKKKMEKEESKSPGCRSPSVPMF